MVLRVVARTDANNQGKQMTKRTRWTLSAAVATALALSACGGGEDSAQARQAAGPTAHALKGGGGGAKSTPTATSVLPTTPPAPGILVRESFGLAGTGDLSAPVRPAGGKGLLKALGRNLNGFWVE